MLRGYRPRLVLAAATVLAGIGGAWLARIPVAERLIEGYCAGQRLDCDVRITRLDFGRVDLSGAKVRGSEADETLAAADEIALALRWRAPWSVAVERVSVERMSLILNAIPGEPVLGPLDALRSGGGGGDLPQLTVGDVQIRLRTEAGDVAAAGSVRFASVGDFDLNLSASPVQLSRDAARLNLAAARLEARAMGGQLSITAKMEAGFSDVETSFEALQAALDVESTKTGLIIEARGEAARLSLADAEVVAPTLSLRAAGRPLAIEDASATVLLAAIETLSVAGATGAGRIGDAQWDAQWTGASLSAETAVASERGAEGPFSLQFNAPSFGASDGGRVRGETLSAAGRFALERSRPGDEDRSLGDPPTFEAASLSGEILLVNGWGDKEALSDRAQDIADRLEAVSPALSASVARAIERAGKRFALTVPVVGRWSPSGASVAVLNGAAASTPEGARLEAKSGSRSGPRSGQASPESPLVELVAPRGGTVSVSGAGTLLLSGGGFPEAALTLDTAEWSASGWKATGTLASGWRAGRDAIELQVEGLQATSSGRVGRGSATVSTKLNGKMVGADWSGGSITGDLAAAWDRSGLSALSSGPIDAKWSRLEIAGLKASAGRLTYTPRGALASAGPKGVTGTGQAVLHPVGVTQGDLLASVSEIRSRIAWRSGEGGFAANFDTGAIEASAASDGLLVDLSTSGLSGNLASAGGGFRLKIPDFAVNLLDAREEDARLFEPLDVEGELEVSGTAADFEGAVLLARSGVQLARGEVRHVFATNEGRAILARTPIVFRSAGLQPSAISPLLRGPANVAGRVDISGGASWGASGFRSNAAADVTDVRFTLANAGIFEQVAGRVELTDVLGLRSEPGQTLTVGKVTLGLQLEDGRLRFQLAGSEGVRLEAAEWPFAGGRLTLAPTLWRFGAAENRLTARAEGWNFTQLLDEFKVPDLSVAGRLSGEFPIILATGSARIDGAELRASDEGGVIRYTGSVADAAATADPNAGLVFDALKDFRYRVLRARLNGDLAGDMELSLVLEGANPAVLNGAPFQINVTIDSALAQLLKTGAGLGQVRQVIESAVGRPE